MKWFKSVMFSLVICTAVETYAANPYVEVDAREAKVTNMLKTSNAADLPYILPYAAELVRKEPSLTKPLSENFHFLYIDTMDKFGGRGEEVIKHAEVYLRKYGEKGMHYGKVISIYNRLQVQKARKLAESGLVFQGDVALDTHTDLFWARDANIAGRRMTWDDAMAWVKTVTIGGYRDWRLPTTEELKDLSARGSVGSHLFYWLYNNNGFSNFQPNFYWSSFGNYPGYAWGVNMSSGQAASSRKSENCGYVWPVRSGK